MDDFSEKINQVLSDPEQMARIMELAKQFGGAEQHSAPPTQQAPPSIPIAPEQIQRILSLLNTAGGKEESLLRALGPFLSAEKSQKMSKAVQAARMSKIISQVLKERNSQ